MLENLKLFLHDQYAEIAIVKKVADFIQNSNFSSKICKYFFSDFPQIPIFQYRGGGIGSHSEPENFKMSRPKNS